MTTGCHPELVSGSNHVIKKQNVPFTNKAAFTLAEVLITLGIIGIVAALTIPTLLNEYKKKETVTKLKATYSILNNAINAAKLDYGMDINQWYIPESNDMKLKSDYFAEHYLIPYLKIVTDCRKTRSQSCLLTHRYLSGAIEANVNRDSRTLVLANGSIIRVFAGKGNYTEDEFTTRIQISININGLKKPNIIGKDVFMVELGGIKAGKIGDRNKVVPYGYNIGYDRNRYLNADETSCNKSSSGLRCFALIMYDNWEIKDDYPW